MAVKFKDYYEILGVPKTATAKEIHLAFRLLARQFHPDVAEDKKEAEVKFKDINEAHEILSNLGKREKYDQLAADWKTKASGMAADGASFLFGGTGFSDFFEYFFGSGEEAQTRHFRKSDFADTDGNARGSDVEADIMVSLEDALRGGHRNIRLRRETPCPRCRDAGGRVSGCTTCGGTGVMKRAQEYDVDIPPGVRQGQVVRISGLGDPPLRSKGRPGDLLVHIHLLKHAEFTVEGADLFHQVEVTPWEAVLGAVIPIKTLEGRANLRVAAGTHAGQRLRLRKLGLPNEHGERGDLFVTVNVQVPNSITDEERAVWESLAEVSSFNPRF